MTQRPPASRRSSAPARQVPRRLPPLRDCIRPGVRVLLVGINPGVRSAQIGHHFAGYSNRFWKLLHESGLVPDPIGTEQDCRLPEWGYGITNLVARATAGIGDLRPAEYAAGRARLIRKIRRYRPVIVALIGVTLYRALFPRLRSPKDPRATARQARSVAAELPPPLPGGYLAATAGPRRSSPDGKRAKAGVSAPELASARTVLGLRPEKLGGADIFVLPNPSGRNANFTYAEMLDAFRALKRFLQG